MTGKDGITEARLDDGRVELTLAGPEEGRNAVVLREAAVERGYGGAFLSFAGAGGGYSVSHRRGDGGWVTTLRLTVPVDDGRSDLQRVADALQPGARGE